MSGNAMQIIESSTACTPSSLTGKIVGGYLVRTPLGHGGMGLVYTATQLSLDRTVALKLLAPELIEDREFVWSFLWEAQVAAKLIHPNLVQIHDAGCAQGFLFYSMEYLPGGSLAALLNRVGRLPLTAGLRVARAAARALAWAEAHAIIHRDIKPANLLISAQGKVKVADLGISIHRHRIPPTGVTRTLGTPYYIAPEQALGKPIDHRADIYALGSTLFETLVGRPPFDSPTVGEVLHAKSTRDAPSLEEVLPGIPRCVARMVARMLARDPGERYASCRETLQVLEDTLRSLEKTGLTLL